MIDYTSVEGKAYVECYTLEDFLQETLELGAKGYKLCLENDYFCFNRGGNYTAHFDAPADFSHNVPVEDDQPSENVIKLSTVDSEAFVAAMLGEITPEEEDNTPSDVNTAAAAPVQEEQAPATTPEVKEEEPQATAPRRGRPPRNAT